MSYKLTRLQGHAHKDGHSSQQNAVSARLRGGWLVFARICWFALAAFSLAAFVTGLPQYFTNLQEVCNSYTCGYGQLLLQSAQTLQNLGISVGAYAVFALVLTITISMVWFIVGGVIFWRKSDEWIALLVSLALVMFAGAGGFNTGLIWSDPVWNLCVGLLFAFGLIALFLVFFLFPDGRFAPRWMVIFAVVFAAFLVDTFMLPFFISNSPFIPWNWPFPLSWVFIISLLSSLVFSQFYRYRRMADPLQRQRTKLIIFAFIIVLLGLIGESLVFEALPQIFPALHPPDPLYQGISLFVWNIAPVLIPISFGTAILRSRLWDIDIIINRTLVYSMLTGTLVVVYVGSILLLQALLSNFTSGNSVALVASTLGVFALFQPLRKRIQARINRRFYRSKYDAARTIAAFSATLRGEIDLHALSEQLVAVVQETMQPTFVSLWLQQPDRLTPQTGRLVTTVEPTPSSHTTSSASETEVIDTPAQEPQLAPRRISRRTVVIGLAASGVVVACGGISWWLLKRRASFTYHGHTDATYDVTWSPDSKRIASTSRDRTVQIWDAADGNHVFIYRGHKDEVYTAAWSPDGKRIASSSKDKTVQVWDAADGSHLFTYRGHKDAVLLVAWSPDGKCLASGSGVLIEDGKPHDDTVQVWDATNGELVFTYHGHMDGVQGVVWSPDGKRIASASLDKTVQVWDATDGGHVFTYYGHTDQVFTLAWSPDGKYLASAGADKTVQVWDAVHGNPFVPLYTYGGHTDQVLGVAWSPDSKRVVSTSVDRTAQVWDALDGGNVFVYNGHTNWVVTPAWSPDGAHIATTSYDNTVQIWSPG